MSLKANSILRSCQSALQRLALLVFAGAAVCLTCTSVMAALGYWPWLTLTANLGGAPVPQAGMIAQLGLTVTAIALCAFLPSNHRILALETSHRRFSVGMDDVARAYTAVHANDRTGAFELKSEFETMRDRLAYLRNHPDLGDLEPPVLELAAQMSFLSRELAEVYSDDHVRRARQFLQQRQEEVARFRDRLAHARAVSDELKHWLHEVKMEEQLASAQLDQLCAELIDALPELGLEQPISPALKVVELAPKVAE